MNTISDLSSEVVRAAKAHCLEPTDVTWALLKQALDDHDRAVKNGHAQCVCEVARAECGLHKVCRRN